MSMPQTPIDCLICGVRHAEFLPDSPILLAQVKYPKASKRVTRELHLGIHACS